MSGRVRIRSVAPGVFLSLLELSQSPVCLRVRYQHTLFSERSAFFVRTGSEECWRRQRTFLQVYRGMFRKPSCPENTCCTFTVPLNRKHCTGPAAGLFNRMHCLVAHGSVFYFSSPKALVLPSLLSNLFKADAVTFAPQDVPLTVNLATKSIVACPLNPTNCKTYCCYCKVCTHLFQKWKPFIILKSEISDMDLCKSKWLFWEGPMAQILTKALRSNLVVLGCGAGAVPSVTTFWQ